ncbi:hypothetical protein SETIT_9G340700v2 [Setaria italica]|uniref:Knottins-like domain-containing protein n=1 Tax=Setaria italica TaxID=4555 RepID=A0A368SQI9_SETIT|nr:hypothetical protein SETIT_9G340700v2 [Setaria italica]
MKPSQRDLSSAAVLLLVVMAAEMASVEAKSDGYCYYPSGKFKGWCLYTDHCADVCEDESNKYVDGKCRGFPSRCYCMTMCPRAPAPAPEIIAAPRRAPVKIE